VLTSARIAGWARDALLLPRVAMLAARAPRDWRAGWERYWGSITVTGVGGDVLWDTGDLDETQTYRKLIRENLDTSLPLVDAGCGNGRFTRGLAPLFPSTIGVDLARNAVLRARAESAGWTDLTFQTLDVTVPDAARPLAAAIGRDVNVFVRGVLHVLGPADRVVAARNLRALVGSQGRLLLAETNFLGSKMDYLRHLGASPRHIPDPLRRAITDTPAPRHFGPDERRAAFPATDWTVVEDGVVDILTIPLHAHPAPDAEHVPGYYAILAPATGSTTEPSPSAEGSSPPWTRQVADTE